MTLPNRVGYVARRQPPQLQASSSPLTTTTPSASSALHRSADIHSSQLQQQQQQVSQLLLHANNSLYGAHLGGLVHDHHHQQQQQHLLHHLSLQQQQQQLGSAGAVLYHGNISAFANMTGYESSSSSNYLHPHHQNILLAHPSTAQAHLPNLASQQQQQQQQHHQNLAFIGGNLEGLALHHHHQQQQQQQHHSAPAPSSLAATTTTTTTTIVPLVPSGTSVTTISSTQSISSVDVCIDQLFPLIGRRQKEHGPPNTTNNSNNSVCASTTDSELNSIVSHIDTIESLNSEEIKAKVEYHPLTPHLISLASTAKEGSQKGADKHSHHSGGSGGSGGSGEHHAAAKHEVAASVYGPSSPLGSSCPSSPGTPSSFPSPILSSPTHLSATEVSLEGFLKGQGINLNFTPKTQKAEEFLQKVKKLQELYEEELQRLNAIAEKYAEQVFSLLKLQSATRPVNDKERQLKHAAIQQRFDYLRAQLRQSVCNSVVLLQKHYNQVKKKRRSLSKKATEVLNNWFFSHLNDPYPSDEEKMMLASLCGLTLNQVNNWFGNKRIRYKRKCLEEEAKRSKQQIPQSGSSGSQGREKSTDSDALSSSHHHHHHHHGYLPDSSSGYFEE